MRRAWITLAAIAYARSAAASDEFRLDYEASSECPGVETFRQSVVGRTRRVRFVPEASDRIQVALKLRGNRFVGTLRMSHASEPERVREVAADTCGEAVDAIALIAALAIDPDASVAPVSIAPPPVAPSPAPPIEPPAIKSPGEKVAEPGALRLSVAGISWIHVGPDPLWGAAIRADWSRGSGFVRASFRAELIGASNTFDAPDTMDYSIFAARVGSCPLRVGNSSLELGACGTLTGGIQRASGLGIAHPEEVIRGWFDLGASLDLRVGEKFFVALNVGPTFAIVRPILNFQTPYVVVHEIPLVGLSTGLGLGFRI